MSSSPAKLISLEQIKLATDDFSQNNYIGGGGFGKVYKGTLFHRTAAIKRLDLTSLQGKTEFLNELSMLAGLHHRNIITFLGYCDEGNEMIIAYDYAVNQSLDHHLRDADKIARLSWAQRLNICIGAAKGLDYLHSGLGFGRRIIHHDVKSANILLDENLDAKVCDFGLSKVGLKDQPFTQFHTRIAGTNYYIDPHYFATNTLAKESDVYSFGVLMFEVLCGRLVFPRDDSSPTLVHLVHHHYKDGLNQLVDHNIRDEIRPESLRTFVEIAYKCINYNLKERPLIDLVIKRLQEALELQSESQEPENPWEVVHPMSDFFLSYAT